MGRCATTVQHPGKYSESLGKASRREYVYLQAFCKLWKPPSKGCASLIRRRPWFESKQAHSHKYAICR
jgi:hypothetical protein